MSKKAIDLFFEISKPNEFIFSIAFKGCAQLGSVEGLTLGKRILSGISVEHRENPRVFQSILNMFTKCNDHKSAESFFARVKRDAVCYASMMKMYNVNEEPEKTLSLFERMKNEKIEPDEIIFTLVIDACSQLGDLELCKLKICQMPSEIYRDSWIQNGLIDMWVS